MEILKGQNIAVIGGNGLIGSAIVKEILLAGGQVINLDLEVGSTDRSFIKFDISDLNKLQEVATTLVKTKKITGLVNASFARMKGWKNHHEQIEPEEWLSNINSQLNGPALISLYVCKAWREEGYKASLVNLSSIFGIVSPPVHLYDEGSFPAIQYPAIKGGIIAFSTFLAAKYGQFGIRVNCISPGVVEGTPMQNKSKFMEGMSMNMLRRFAEPGEIAAPVVFLLSDKSSFITGQNIIVDGGWTKI